MKTPTPEQKQEIVIVRLRDGGEMKVIVPRSPADVDMQPNVPAWVLTMFAFALRTHDGRYTWSPYTRDTLKRLSDDYGDDTLRRHLSSLLIDIEGGFRPDNPLGLIIHRVRSSTTTRTLQI